MENVNQLRDVFRKSLELEPDAYVDELQYRGITKWDSLAHMSLVAGIEDAFDIMIDTSDVVEMSSFAKAREIVGKYGVELSD